MEDLSKTSEPSKINRHILPLTADLVAASKNLLNSAGSLRDRLQEDHSFIVKLEFGSPEAMRKADEFLTQLAIRTSVSFESLSHNFLLYKKLFLNPLQELLQLHLQRPRHEYPDKLGKSGSTLVPIKEYASIMGMYRQLSEENHESSITAHQFNLMHAKLCVDKLGKEYDKLHNQFGVYQRCGDFMRCLEAWDALNSVLGKIDDWRQRILTLDHQARTAFGFNVKFFEGIRLRILPVRPGCLTDNSIIIPASQLLPAEIISLCRDVLTGSPGRETIDVAENKLELARALQKVLHSEGLKTIYPARYDYLTRPTLSESDQAKMKLAVEALGNILPMLLSARDSAPPLISEPTSQPKPAKKRSGRNTNLKETPIAAQAAPKQFKISIRTMTHVLVDGQQVAKEPRMALIGLAVVSELNSNAPVSFSTKELIPLIHNKSQNTNYSQVWYRYRAELNKTLLGVSIDGDDGHYTISGLCFDSQLTLEQLKAGLIRLVRSAQADQSGTSQPQQS